MPQLPRIPLRAASTPHPLQLPGGGLQPPMRGGSFSGAAGGGKPRPGSPIWRMHTPVQMQQQPQPMTLQVAFRSCLMAFVSIAVALQIPAQSVSQVSL